MSTPLEQAAAAARASNTAQDPPTDSKANASAWPTLDEAALFGWPGDVVRAIDPHTEADRALVLATALVLGGNMLGRTPHVYVGDTPHRCNLNAAGVGETGKSRKGTSLASVRRIVIAADALWADCEKGGLSSGEGLIWAVRDPIEQTRPVREKGRTVDTETFIADEGVPDKRLLCVEEELAAVLKASGRDGATLSETIRKAWDGRDVLRTMTKNSPAVATGAHVSILAHITFDELRVTLTDTERANGLANRYLWLAAKRSKSLPEPTRLDEATVHELAGRLADAKQWATETGEFRRTGEARALWGHVYDELSAGLPGLAGATIGRAEAQVLRLSITYAALSGATMIGTHHLLAALAFWDYCEASVSLIFGDATGDATADRLLAAIRSAGALDRTAAYELFGKHVSAARLDQALERLVTAGRLEVATEQTGGRPRTTYRAKTVRAGGGRDFAGTARAWLAEHETEHGGEESEGSEERGSADRQADGALSSPSSLTSHQAEMERPAWKRCGCGELVPWREHCPRCRPGGDRLTA